MEKERREERGTVGHTVAAGDREGGGVVGSALGRYLVAGVVLRVCGDLHGGLKSEYNGHVTSAREHGLTGDRQEGTGHVPACTEVNWGKMRRVKCRRIQKWSRRKRE